MNQVLRLFLTCNSISLFVIVFCVQNQINPLSGILGQNSWIMYILFMLIPIFLTYVSLCLCKLLSESSLKAVKSIETAENNFLADYLAFFFVALSIKEMSVFWVVFFMTLILTHLSSVSYFNPLFLLFRFKFYYVQTNENVKIMLITRKQLRNATSFESCNVKRINDYTFIEL